ncbi:MULTISPECIES: type II 3-dehydroquinate dehydratase [unclassified Colwellia]|uniref:type II 3-dehydroquinate dehydratase n=1 Tax=unclassified Colwellia TaxID=196834 RepID=UPI0015F6B1A5|nr:MULTISPECIES: type II 3-dehydroquinate dehydratase [unclassified Colwellia]MBA6232770.1 type II 3-dehydroquinate dehydratase [Colwellia sp. MB02u-7]MBA6236142.1 type II 3-dehydroquinate dehydratase [Colwellia sp. MB02u-11]MBA6256605.1 type II 3-dehydroquinate dehydratase [Colwellia sp. MB3u-28]MBA6261320.1 type II 3-dehydroquinate dehydratase [Colwellia sp. MB3u-41]MBA6298458.1 type II 3-dehydroquinate dehydratase [Colwellia sp. MB3u-22]
MTTKFKVLVINGPNLNMLGKREPEIYGAQSLTHIIDNLTLQALPLGIELSHLQSNAEHLLIEKIHNAHNEIDFIVINPAAFTHTSIAIRDALLCVDIPFIEVHLSNVHARESFRHHSYLSDKAIGVICGLGADGYKYALGSAYAWLTQHKS